MLGLFATRHGTSLLIAIREVEFFAFGFFGRVGASSENEQKRPKI
jgi:hypothetical protein